MSPSTFPQHFGQAFATSTTSPRMTFGKPPKEMQTSEDAETTTQEGNEETDHRHRRDESCSRQWTQRDDGKQGAKASDEAKPADNRAAAIASSDVPVSSKPNRRSALLSFFQTGRSLISKHISQAS
eukprot:jgi/Hompol1/4226/HPOL_003521-RA